MGLDIKKTLVSQTRIQSSYFVQYLPAAGRRDLELKWIFILCQRHGYAI